MLRYGSRRGFLGLAAVTALARPVLAADTTPSRDAPDLSRARALIKAKNYSAAITELKAVEAKSQHPDVYSLMGYALRKSGDQAQAMVYYNKALAMDPNHRGALEYQGELYIELGQLDKAQQNLNKLDRVCSFGCEEEADLKAAIAEARKGKA